MGQTPVPAPKLNPLHVLPGCCAPAGLGHVGSRPSPAVSSLSRSLAISLLSLPPNDSKDLACANLREPANYEIVVAEPCCIQLQARLLTATGTVRSGQHRPRLSMQKDLQWLYAGFQAAGHVRRPWTNHYTQQELTWPPCRQHTEAGAAYRFGYGGQGVESGNASFDAVAR